MLSVILPSYNEEAMIPIAEERLSGILDEADIDFQLVFVDDGSRDQTWGRICACAEHNPRVLGVHFSRNFGKEAAMFAGLAQAEGDCCVIMDCDLQHPPEKVVEMYRLWEEGYEVVEGIKEDRGEENMLHRAAARGFYRLISDAIHMDMNASSDFKLLDRKVVDTLNQLRERAVFFRALSFWVGFKKTTVMYRVQERTEGSSKWSTKGLLRYALSSIASFSAGPLYLPFCLGGVFLVLALAYGIRLIAGAVTGARMGGSAAVLLALLIFAGLTMMVLGIFGFYIARIYEEVKGRPRYIISEICKKV